eukprot:NODE_4847_length_635_cov_1.037931.p2 GENE.NODE_4847_length_635_cov_1.037931~~NODE_4847_length_635_cov_1.037931.p2  ORF type:complete len:68 (-),score=3.73 NODE_4847_length_635_cov_1.037931:198-401(-)
MPQVSEAQTFKACWDQLRRVCLLVSCRSSRALSWPEAPAGSWHRHVWCSVGGARRVRSVRRAAWRLQ